MLTELLAKGQENSELAVAMAFSFATGPAQGAQAV